MRNATCCTGVTFPRQTPVERGELRFPSEARPCDRPPCHRKPVRISKNSALSSRKCKRCATARDERGGAQGGMGRRRRQVPPRAVNLSHYIALRGQDLIDLQLRLAARGLSSLGRSEAKVDPALDTLIVTLRRLTGETNVPYPRPRSSGPGASELEAESERIFGKRPKGAPRVRVMATLPPRPRPSPNSSTTWSPPAWTAPASIAPTTTPRRGAGWSRTCAKPRPGSSGRAKF